MYLLSIRFNSLGFPLPRVVKWDGQPYMFECSALLPDTTPESVASALRQVASAYGLKMANRIAGLERRSESVYGLQPENVMISK